MTDQGASGGANGDAGRLLDAAARARLAVGLADLFLPKRLRLNEWQRETTAALLTRLIRSIEEGRSPSHDLLLRIQDFMRRKDAEAAAATPQEDAA